MSYLFFFDSRSSSINFMGWFAHWSFHHLSYPNSRSSLFSAARLNRLRCPLDNLFRCGLAADGGVACFRSNFCKSETFIVICSLEVDETLPKVEVLLWLQPSLTQAIFVFDLNGFFAEWEMELRFDFYHKPLTVAVQENLRSVGPPDYVEMDCLSPYSDESNENWNLYAWNYNSWLYRTRFINPFHVSNKNRQFILPCDFFGR